MVDAPAIPPTAALAQPPRALYAGVMTLAAALGVGAAATAAGLAGGSRETVRLAAVIVAAGALPGFAPAVMGRQPFWGLFVLGASIVRLLLIVALTVFVLRTREGVGRETLWGGVIAGAGLILMIESAAAVLILKMMQPRAAAATPSITSAERV